VQAAVFAADSIARDVARIHATEPDGSTASERSARHSEMILEDHGLPTGDVIALHCSHDPCATPGGTVSVEVRIPVPVPGVAPVGSRGGSPARCPWWGRSWGRPGR